MTSTPRAARRTQAPESGDSSARSSEFEVRRVRRARVVPLLRTSNFKLRTFRGFTLVELLVVIAILGILISLVTAGAQAARRRGAITKAKAMIAAMETAITMYHGDLDEYPPTGNGGLVKALTNDEENTDWQGPYLDLKQEDLAGEELIDPWGRAYVYVSVNGGSPQHRNRSYDLYSFGPNGQDDQGSQDDLVNW